MERPSRPSMLRAVVAKYRGNRSWAAIIRAPFRRGHYRGLIGAFAVYVNPLAGLYRYLTGQGTYPYAPALRTPLGVLTPWLYSSHDFNTVHEVFARRDYACGTDIRLVVDVGANIGISALYFLSRSPQAHAILFEPAPANVLRLRRNLARFEARYELHELAVGLSTGEVDFGTEWTGRYGGIGIASDTTIRVRCEEINSILDGILGRFDTIDVLKVDVEGLERHIVAAVRPDLLERVRLVYYETNLPEPLHHDLFSHSFDCQTNRLVRRPKPLR